MENNLIYILNKQEKIINILNNTDSPNKVPFFDDILSQSLTTGADTYKFSTIFNNKNSETICVGNKIAFMYKGNFLLFQIVSVDEIHNENMEIEVYCESAGLSLINNVCRKTKLVSSDIRKFLETVLQDTEWNIGFVDMSITNSIDVEIPTASVYSIIQNNLANYEAEIRFRCELNNGRISRKFVDVFKQRGRFTGKRFEFGKNIEGLTRNVDSTELFTALIGEGKDGLSFKDIELSDVPNKPLGADFVYDQEAYNLYNHNGYHLMGVYKYDTESPEELLRATYKKLQECKKPKITYDVNISLLDYDVSVGDTVNIIDRFFNPPLFLKARVNKLEESLTDSNMKKCVLSNFIEVSSNINGDLLSQIKDFVNNTVTDKFPIGTDDIQNGAITGDKIYENSITTDHLKASLVEAVKGKFESLEAKDAKIENLIADKADIGELNAIVGNIDSLKSEVAEIETLVNGNLSSENIQAGGITGDRLNMSTIFVDDANIIQINADKINSGELNTSKIALISEDGGMKLVGNTQQFLDKEGNIRIQLGRDAKGDFDFYILDDSGNILFNTRGITGNAIENGLIKNEMISDGAVGGEKINWDSFTTEFNKETNTHSINSSKVILDGTNQNLTVKFDKLESTMGEIEDGLRANEFTKKLCLYYGYPIAINKAWNVNGAVNIYKNYDIVVFGDNYNKKDHEAHADTVKIIDRLRTEYPQIEVFGYVPCAFKGGTKNLSTEEIKELIDLWADIGVTGIFYDEFGFDYWNTRERQNELVLHGKSHGLNAFVNSWEDTYIFSTKPMTISWMPDFEPNPNGLAPVVDENDYSLYEHLFFQSYTGTQYASNPWRVYKAYDYYNKVQEEYGMTWFEKFGTRTISLDGIHSTLEIEKRKELMTMALLGAKTLNVDGVGFGDENWGSRGTFYEWDYPQYTLRENGKHTVKTTFDGVPIAYEANINGINLKLTWNNGIADKVELDTGERNIKVDEEIITDAWITQASIIKSHTTAINVINGKIDTIIRDTTIEKDGEVVKLKDEYNKTVLTVDSMKNTIGEHNTKIDQNTGKIMEVGVKTNELERTVDSLTSRISETEVSVENVVNDVEGLTNEVTTTNKKVSNIEQEVGSIKLNVSSHTDKLGSIDNKFAEIKLETDNISQRVSNTEIKTNTIENTLGEKASKQEVSEVNNRVTSIDANLQGITQRVSSTESKTESIESTLDGKASKSEVQNVKDQVSSIEIDLDGITNRVSNTESNINSVNGQIQNTVTKSEFTEFKQNTNSFQFTVEQRSSINNIIENSTFAGSGRGWRCNGEFWSGTYNGYDFKGRFVGAIKNSNPYNNPEQYLMSERCFRVKKNTTYTLNFKFALEQNVDSMDAFVILSDSENTNYGQAIHMHTAKGGSQTNNWQEQCVSKIFNTGNYEWIWLRFDHNGMKPNVNVHEWCWLYISEVGVYEGDVGQIKWVPSGGESYSSNFMLDSSGLRATFDDGSYTYMGRDGFEWYNSGTGHSYHALTYVTSFGIPAGNPGRTSVKLPVEFTKRKNSLRWTVALRGYYYNTSGSFFPFHVHVSGIGNAREVDGQMVCDVEGYCKIQNVNNSGDVQFRDVTAMLIAIA